MPPDRGVFLRETRRMHPDVCRFISEQIYEGRLVSHPSCATQNTEFGTGLRWLEPTTSIAPPRSEEEAEMVVAEISRLIGTTWTDQHGRRHRSASRTSWWWLRTTIRSICCGTTSTADRPDPRGERWERSTSSRDERRRWSSSP